LHSTKKKNQNKIRNPISLLGSDILEARSPMQGMNKQLAEMPILRATMPKLKWLERHVAYETNKQKRYQISVSFTQLENSNSWYLPFVLLLLMRRKQLADILRCLFNEKK
jgi:hypothetical protein